MNKKTDNAYNIDALNELNGKINALRAKITSTK